MLVSSGEAEIGLQQVSELMSNPEVEVIGMLPAELQLTTLYSAAVTTSARQAEAAKALIKALTAPSAARPSTSEGTRSGMTGRFFIALADVACGGGLRYSP